MVAPTNQHLYVLQNEFGLIKIGRSLHPRQRVAELRFYDRCSPSIVALFEYQGDGEEWLLCELAKYRVFGEWFDGSDVARAAVEAALEQGLEWPHTYRPRLAKRWTKMMLAMRRIRRAHREIRRMRQEGVDLEKPSVTLDMLFLDACRPDWLPKDGFPSLHQRINGSLGVSWSTMSRCGRYESAIRLPHRYTSDVNSALLLWPDVKRPQVWEGTPFSCCLAALQAHERSLDPSVSKEAVVATKGKNSVRLSPGYSTNSAQAR